MNPCPQCGAIPQTSDKFCNVCGFSLGPSPFGAPAGGGFGGQPQYGAQPGYGNPQGGGLPPIDSMPFTNDAYGNPQQQGGGFAQSGGYPAGAGGFGQPQQQGGGFGGYDQGGGFGQPQGGGFGQPQGFQDQTAQPAFGGAYGSQPQQGGFGGGGFGQQAPAQPAYGGFPQGGQPQPGYGGGQGFDPNPYGQPQPQQPQAPPQAAQGQQAPAYQPPPPQPLPANALRGFVLSYQANPAGDFWPLTGGRKVIGRANSGEQVDIPLADATTSSRHAAITVDGTSGTITLEDTGSTNGTFVNEDHIGFNGRRELKDGDKLRFGGYVAFVKVVTRTH